MCEMREKTDCVRMYMPTGFSLLVDSFIESIYLMSLRVKMYMPTGFSLLVDSFIESIYLMSLRVT